MTPKKLRSVLFILATVSLVVGMLVYLMYGPKTYISKIVYRFVSLPKIKGQDTIIAKFLRFYLADYLWAFSMSCWLHIIFLPSMKQSILWTLFVGCFGIVYELCQGVGIISGTKDYIDCLLYLLAGVTVNIIIFLKEKTK